MKKTKKFHPNPPSGRGVEKNRGSQFHWPSRNIRRIIVRKKSSNISLIKICILCTTLYRFPPVMRISMPNSIGSGDHQAPLWWPFFDVDFRFQTWESVSGGSFLRRFRICGRNLRIQASRRQNLRKTTSNIYLLIRFSSFVSSVHVFFVFSF